MLVIELVVLITDFLAYLKATSPRPFVKNFSNNALICPKPCLHTNSVLKNYANKNGKQAMIPYPNFKAQLKAVIM